MIPIRAEEFCDYALEIFCECGHTDALEPEFANHSAKQFIYRDCDKDFFLRRDQRELLQEFDNVSRLFTVNEVAFFSLNLRTSSCTRSQSAHDVHMLIQAAVSDPATICLSRHVGKMIFSFAGFGLPCLLSDWYSSGDEFLQKLDIANMTIDDSKEYFCDFVYLFARPYYFANCKPTYLHLLPTNFFLNPMNDTTRAAADDFFNEQRISTVRKYGTDYVEHVTPAPKKSADKRELNFTPEAEITPGNSSADENSQNSTTSDESDLPEIDVDIFADPELLLNYIKANSRRT